MTTPVVLVHGIRTSATMWRPQVEFLEFEGVPVRTVDLPGHGSRLPEPFGLDEARHSIDLAVTAAAADGPVLLVGHSMGGFLALDRAANAGLPLAGVMAVSCTALPRGWPLAVYRRLLLSLDSLPDRGLALTRLLLRSLPTSTRDDFGAGGYAFDAQHAAIPAMSTLDPLADVAAIEVPLWLVNGTIDQLRIDERRFRRAAPQARMIIVPGAHHLVTAMRPKAFNLILAESLASLASA